MALIVPLIASAQLTAEKEAELQSEIRAALLSDPRTENLTEEELNGLIGALANEAEAQGVVDDYIPPEPNFAIWYGESTMPTLWGYTLSEGMLYAIILVALGIAVVLLRRMMVMHHEMPPTPSA
jgi:hypothetical protein